MGMVWRTNISIKRRRKSEASGPLLFQLRSVDSQAGFLVPCRKKKKRLGLHVVACVRRDESGGRLSYHVCCPAPAIEIEPSNFA